MNTDLTTLSLMQLPASERAMVELWDAEFRTITKPVTLALEALAKRLEVNFSTAYRKWQAWQRDGARGLMSRAKGEKKKTLAPEFIAYWKQLCCENQRKCAPAYRKFVRMFKAGEMIPGIGPDVPRYKVPRGYTYDALMRHAPTHFELFASRRGLSAADGCRPLVFSTRQNMQVGQEIVFDDWWDDFEVVVLGNAEPARLLHLGAMDVFSGSLFAMGSKPRVRRDTDGSRTNLSETDALFFVVHVLEDHGYRAAGARLILEAGTMTVSEAVARLVFDLTGGKVICHVGATSNAVAFAGQYAGRGKGNFRLKAMLESIFNLIHNETADMRLLPGQTGSNSRLNVPDDLHGRRAETIKWLQAMPALPEHIRQQIQLGMVEYHTADWLVRDIVDRMNRRTEHELEGWIEAGLTTVDYEIKGLGMLSAGNFMERLGQIADAGQRAGLQALGIPRPRKLSPWEVYSPAVRALARFRPEHSARVLYGARRSEPVKVGRDHLITFEDKEISPSPLRFHSLQFRPGEKFDAVLNPWKPDKLHLFLADGSWVGQVPILQTADRTDPAAVREAMAEAERTKAIMLAPVAKRGLAITTERLITTRENIELISRPKVEAEPLTPEERREARAAAADILAPVESLESGVQSLKSAAAGADGDFLEAISQP